MPCVVRGNLQIYPFKFSHIHGRIMPMKKASFREVGPARHWLSQVVLNPELFLLDQAFV